MSGIIIDADDKINVKNLSSVLSKNSARYMKKFNPEDDEKSDISSLDDSLNDPDCEPDEEFESESSIYEEDDEYSVSPSGHAAATTVCLPASQSAPQSSVSNAKLLATGSSQAASELTVARAKFCAKGSSQSAATNAKFLATGTSQSAPPRLSVSGDKLLANRV